MAADVEARKKLVRERRLYELAIDRYLTRCYRIREVVSVAGFAREVGKTRPYVSARLAMILGAPLKEILRTRQLERAKLLLRSSALPLTEVAARSGFKLRAFERTFSRSYGVTPGAFRRNLTE